MGIKLDPDVHLIQSSTPGPLQCKWKAESLPTLIKHSLPFNISLCISKIFGPWDYSQPTAGTILIPTYIFPPLHSDFQIPFLHLLYGNYRHYKMVIILKRNLNYFSCSSMQTEAVLSLIKITTLHLSQLLNMHRYPWHRCFHNTKQLSSLLSPFLSPKSSLITLPP